MNKIIVVLLFLLAFFLSGCINGQPHDIPEKCQQFEGEYCEMFSCLVDNCWCEYDSPDGETLQSGNTVVLTEEDAISVVSSYLQTTDSEYTEVRRAMQLNARFWNVFAYNPENDEETFTVASDGTIIKTLCGV